MRRSPPGNEPYTNFCVAVTVGRGFCITWGTAPYLPQKKSPLSPSYFVIFLSFLEKRSLRCCPDNGGWAGRARRRACPTPAGPRKAYYVQVLMPSHGLWSRLDDNLSVQPRETFLFFGMFFFPRLPPDDADSASQCSIYMCALPQAGSSKYKSTTLPVNRRACPPPENPFRRPI